MKRILVASALLAAVGLLIAWKTVDASLDEVDWLQF